jgi:hypothetical protein
MSMRCGDFHADTALVGPALTAFGASTLPSPQDNEAMIHLAGNGIFVGAMALGGLLASAL